MVFEPMTEQGMAELLQNFSSLEKRIILKRGELQREMETLEECIERNSYGRQMKEVADVYGTACNNDRVYQVLTRSYRDMEDQVEDIINEMDLIERDEQKMRRVKSCIRKLSMQQADIIEELYIRGVGWEEYGRKHFISRSTVFRNRKKAMEHLLVLYNRKSA